jgi:hypothetical protein
MVLERTGDTGLITDQEANDIINSAARILFLRIATKYPDVFAQRSSASVAVPANCVVPYTTLATGDVFRILNTYAGVTGAPESQMVMINNFDRVADRHVYESAPTAPALPYRYLIEGENVVFTPITAGTFDARFCWVQMPVPMALDADQCWGGMLDAYHDHVAMFSAMMVTIKDSSGPSAYTQFYAMLDDLLAENFGKPHTFTGQYIQNPYSTSPREGRP